MQFSEIVSTLIKLFFGGVGTFLAILLWSKTRDLAWILIVVGTLISYADIVYATLQKFGIITDIVFFLYEIPLFSILLSNLPMIFFIIGFIVVITRKRYR